MSDFFLIKLQNFWDLDSLRIKEQEKSVYENFTEDIKFEDNRYTVKLPFKQDHPTIPHNYYLSLKRLNSLRIRLDINKELLQNYDNVIKEQLQLGIIEKVDTPVSTGEGIYIPH